MGGVVWDSWGFRSDLIEICSLEVEGGKPIQIRCNPTNSTHFAGISGRSPQTKWEIRRDSGLDLALEVEGGKPIEIRWNPTNSIFFPEISGESRFPQNGRSCLDSRGLGSGSMGIR